MVSIDPLMMSKSILGANIYWLHKKKGKECQIKINDTQIEVHI